MAVSGFLCYVLVAVTVLSLPLATLATNTRDICNRDPPDTSASRTTGDNGFRIKIVGRPQPERYVPEQVYTVVINGTLRNQYLLGFMLVAVPLNARDESTAMGNFQHLSTGVTKFAEDCPHVVTHTYANSKAGVEVLWTAPPAGTGCIEFRATVIEYSDIWYKDDGALTRVLCEETGTTEDNHAAEMIPDCCACGTAKYQLTFHGTWSRRTHPQDYPTQKRLLHWSNIVGASHSRQYTLWQYGGYSTQGIKQVCEFGYSRILEQEMREHSRDVRTVIKTPGIWWSDPHGLEQTRWARFSVDRKSHLVSMLTMLGPSPDWCVGVSAVNLCLPNCTWTGDMEVDLLPWDAGTDDGIEYMSSNKVSSPQQRIHKITNTFPNNPNSPFHSAEPIPPLAKLRIRRIHPKAEDEPAVCSEEDVDYDSEVIEESEDLLDEMEEKKARMMKEGKCAVSDWLDWSECSVTCGVGQRFRKRMYINPDVDERMCGSNTMESENCIGVENECESREDTCSVTRWSDWSPCSVTCGKGMRTRRRYYFKEEDEEGCERRLEEQDICMTDVLDCNNIVLNFTAICTQPKEAGKCRRGKYERFYFDVDMSKCLPFTYTGCRGNSNNFVTEDACMQSCLPVMKQLMMDRQLQREKEEEMERQVDEDPQQVCTVPSEIGPCKAAHERYYFDTNMLKCLPFTFGGCQGNSNNFFTEDACMDKCFMVMKQMMMERRQQGQEQSNNDRQDSSDTEADNDRQDSHTEADGAKPVKEEKKKGKKHKGKEMDPSRPRVDCMVTQWAEWSGCSSTCGRGYRYKRRMIKRQPENGGRKCPKKVEKKKRCKLPKCAPGERCRMSAWGQWTPCPQTCGSGSIQERMRQVESAPDNDLSRCGARIERRYCTLPPCPQTQSDRQRTYYP